MIDRHFTRAAQHRLGARSRRMLWRLLRPLAAWIAVLCLQGIGTAQSCPSCPSGGSWFGPFLLDSRVGTNPSEIAHAALIPTGYYAGKVLLWKTSGTGVEGWIFNPESPTQMIRVEQDLQATIFCGSGTWDTKGHLVVAGGLALHGEGAAETYRFDPFKLKAPTYPPGTGPHAAGTPWSQLSNLSIKRYYPTTITLSKVSWTSTCGSLALTVQGGSSTVISGPPHVSLFEGTEFWQFLPPGGQTWSPTLRPDPAHWNSPNQTQLAPGTVLHNYERMPLTSPPNPLLDAYARAKQLAERQAGETIIKGRIFIASDVESIENIPYPNVPNAGGLSWGIRPPWPGDNPCWQLWPGPAALPGAGPAGTSNDHYYAPVVILHTRAIKNRLLQFGGSRRPIAGEIDPCVTAQQCNPLPPPPLSTWWPVDSDVEEFIPDYTSVLDPIHTGVWVQKAAMCSPRVFHTATVLPTGQVFIEGGTSVDKWHNTCRCYPCDQFGNPSTTEFQANRPCGVAVPELYDPRQFQTLGSGSSCRATMPNIPVTTPPAPPFAGPTPRGYHHFAVLLMDGSVFVAGGDEGGPQTDYPSSILYGEVYYPPYFAYGTQPTITNYPTEIAFDGAQFTIKATVFHRGIDRVVLTKPAATTHHFDNDQLYIELDFNAPSYSPDAAGQPIVLTATPPHHSLGPPGWYQLWVVEEYEAAAPPTPAKLIPSTAKLVSLQ